MSSLDYKVYEFNSVEYFIETEHGNFLVYKYLNKQEDKLFPFNGTYKQARDFLDEGPGKLVDKINILDFLKSNFKIGMEISP